MVMVVLREITGFASTRLSRRGCARREREGKRGMQLDVYGGGKNGKARGEEGSGRTQEGDYVACVRSELARWRRWRRREYRGRGSEGWVVRGGWKREEGGITRTRGTRGNERVARAKVLSLQTWQSSRKSQNPRTISRSTLPCYRKTTSGYICMYIRARETATCHTQASPRTSAARHHRPSSFIRAC